MEWVVVYVVAFFVVGLVTAGYVALRAVESGGDTGPSRAVESVVDSGAPRSQQSLADSGPFGRAGQLDSAHPGASLGAQDLLAPDEPRSAW